MKKLIFTIFLFSILLQSNAKGGKNGEIGGQFHRFFQYFTEIKRSFRNLIDLLNPTLTLFCQLQKL